MAIDYRLCVIGGLHRSGTSYIGSIVSQYPNITTLFEPFNAEYGVVGVPYWYPYVPTEGDSSNIVSAEFVERVIAFDGKWSRNPQRHSHKLATRILSNVANRTIGNRNTFRWDWLKLQKKLGRTPQTICWKDPFSTFFVGYLAKLYGVRSVCMVRHRGALCWRSVKKLGWGFDIDNLRKQEALVSDFGVGITDSQWELARKNDVASLALLWKIMARYLHRHQEVLAEVLCICHEAFCLQPTVMANLVCRHFDIPISSTMINYIEQTSNEGSADAPQNDPYFYSRNSRAIIDGWRGKLSSDDEQLLQELIGDELLLFYPQW